MYALIYIFVILFFHFVCVFLKNMPLFIYFFHFLSIFLKNAFSQNSSKETPEKRVYIILLYFFVWFRAFGCFCGRLRPSIPEVVVEPQNDAYGHFPKFVKGNTTRACVYNFIIFFSFGLVLLDASAAACGHRMTWHFFL